MKIMAVDFGDSRTGIAICDRGELLASPVCVIEEKHFPTTVQKTAQQAQEQGAERIVVGHPLNMDGSKGPESTAVRGVCAAAGRTGIGSGGAVGRAADNRFGDWVFE